MANLTVSNNEINDTTRPVSGGNQSDGRAVPDSSFGIYPAATNLALQSNHLNTTPWAPAGLTVGENGTAGPYGNNDANLITSVPSAGLIGWYKASALALSDGVAVATWADSSGSGNTLTQATGANQPTYKAAVLGGKPAVRFNGTSTSMATAAALFSGAGARTIIVVSQLASAAGVNPLAGQSNAAGASAWFVLQRRTTGDPYLAGYSNDLAGGALTAAPQIATVTYDGTTAVLYANGTSSASGAKTYNTVANPFTVGADSGTEFLNGDLAEVLVFNRAITTAERNQIESYLSVTYGITGPAATTSPQSLPQTFAVSASTAYVASFYARAGTKTSAAYRIYDATHAADIVAQTSYYSQINASTYTRIDVPFTTPVGCTSVTIYPESETAGSAGTMSIWQFQTETGSLATPRINTTTASATRAAARVQQLATAVGEVQGAISVSLTMDWLSTNPPPGTLIAFEWTSADFNNQFAILYSGSGVWTFQLTRNGTVTTTTRTYAHNAGDTVILTLAWTNTTLSVSHSLVSAAAFATVARTGTAGGTALPLNFDIGQNVGGNQIATRVNWVLAMAGIPSNADMTTLAALGRTDPTLLTLSAASLSTAVWPANDSSYSIVSAIGPFGGKAGIRSLWSGKAGVR